MKIMIAIQTDMSSGFVTESAFPSIGAYNYTPDLEDALLFSTVADAVKWIERTSFYNGKAENKSYSGSPRLVRVEVETLPTYKMVGEVE